MVSRRVLLAALPIAVGSMASGGLAGDVIEFTNGRTLEGNIIEETDDQVTLDVDGGRITFPRHLIHEVRRDAGSADAPAASDGAPGKAASSLRPLLAGARPAAEEWSLLWSPERRVGWRQVQTRFDATGARFDETVMFPAEGEEGDTELHLVEVAAPDLYPVSFRYQEVSAHRDLVRIGRIEGDRLVVETLEDGERSTADHPLPPGFRLPAAARAFVLGEGERLPGGWKGVTFDPRTGRFVELSMRADRTERILWEGHPVDVLVLTRRRGAALEEERVTREGETLTADLNGPGLTAVGSTRRRVEAYRDGQEVAVGEEEERARTLYVSPEDGFRILKPGAAWTFVPGGRDGNPRVTIKDVGGIAFVRVEVADAPPGAPVEAEGAALEKRLRFQAAAFKKVEDGYEEFAGERAYRILCDVTLKGDDLRTFAVCVVRKGRTWTLVATCPRRQWEEASPFLHRILDGFEWL